MRTILISLVLLFSIAWEVPAQSRMNRNNSPVMPVGEVIYHQNANARVNVYSGPSTEYATVGSLPCSSRVLVIDRFPNGWRKIQYNYTDPETYMQKTLMGYVSGEYFASSRSSGYGATISKVPASPYSGQAYNPHRGKLTVWSSTTSEGKIEVFLNDGYEGMLTSTYRSGIPNCGDPGTLVIDKPGGAYKLTARGQYHEWERIVTITPGECLIIELDKQGGYIPSVQVPRNSYSQTYSYTPVNRFTQSRIGRFKSNYSEIPLRAEPYLNSRIIYRCPSTAEVQILEYRGDFILVRVNNNTGYVLKEWLE